MASSRLAAIKAEKEFSDKGGYYNGKSFVDDEVLESLGIEKYVARDHATTKMDNFLSIIPPRSKDTYFGYRLPVHRNIGPQKDSFVCPAAHRNLPCPVCEDRARMERDPDVDKDEIRALYIQNVYLFFVLDELNDLEREKGPQLFVTNPTVQKGIAKQSTDSRTGEVMDISDPDDGRILVFTRTGKGMRSTKYDGFKLEPRKSFNKDLLEVIPDFEDIVVLASYEEIAESYSCGVTASRSEPQSDQGTLPWDGPVDANEVDEAPVPASGDAVPSTASTSEVAPATKMPAATPSKLEEMRQRLAAMKGAKKK